MLYYYTSQVPRILFRCDSSELIGTGHVTRSVALAEAFLNAGWQVDFYGKLKNPEWLKFFLESYRNINIIPFGSNEINKSRYEVICFDHYTITIEEVTSLSNLGKFIIWLVDDKSPHFMADLYVSTLPSSYLSDFYKGKCNLFGLEYALIRESIRSIVESVDEKTRGTKVKKSVAILTGGTENVPLINMFINQLNSINSDLSYLTNSEDFVFQSQSGFGTIINIPKSANFFSELMQCDYVISPSSVTSWEVVYARIPLAVYGVLENHTATYKFLTESGIATGLGLHTNNYAFMVKEKELSDFIHKDNTRFNKMRIDGLGSERVFKYIIQSI